MLQIPADRAGVQRIVVGQHVLVIGPRGAAWWLRGRWESWCWIDWGW